MASEDVIERWREIRHNHGSACKLAGDALCAELEKCREELAHAKCGNDTLNDLLNQANRRTCIAESECDRLRAHLAAVEALKADPTKASE